MSSVSAQSSKRVTIRDVAQEAGVSHTMVSLILNGKTAGSDETRERVMSAVHRLGYRLDSLYRGKTREGRAEAGRSSTGIIAYIIPDWMSDEAADHDGFYSKSLKGVNAAATDLGYNVLLCPLAQDPVGLPAVVINNQVDGVLVDMTLPVSWLQLLANGSPCVCMNRYYPDAILNYVTPHWIDAARQQVQYAWDLGHRNFGFFESDDGIPHLVRPYDFLWRALEQLGGVMMHPKLSRQRVIQMRGDGMYRAAIAFVDEWLALESRPTAIMTVDGLGTNLARAFRERGVNVPGQVSIVSRYGHEIAARSEPALTSYAYPNREIARAATNLLIDRIRTGSLQSSHVMLAGKMIVRDSARMLTMAESEASLQRANV